eukprot:UN21847
MQDRIQNQLFDVQLCYIRLMYLHSLRTLLNLFQAVFRIVYIFLYKNAAWRYSIHVYWECYTPYN